jgi:predicted ATPase/class 3 adenylate cyclase
MPELPTGTVTLLFTDIEGSTLLTEQHPQAMRTAQARHDALLREAIMAHGGAIFRSTGDGCCAVFATALDAVAAAVVAQRALHAERWGEVGPVRVRMALHTGAVELRGGDYVGLALNRVARLLSAGHGGQVLLSQPTYELGRDVLPQEVYVRDLGEHLLRDLERPERVFQLVLPGLPADFPPLRTLASRPNNLPLQRSRLVGRERELAAVAALLRREDAGMLTLTGAGGSGKTRLALHAAADLLDDFTDGVFVVWLASITDPMLAVIAIAQVLGVREVAGRPVLQSIKDFLQAKQLLLLLDNFEQVLSAAPVVADLLAACPSLKVLVTSRAALHLYREREFPLPPLMLPDLEQLPPLERLTQFEAVRLFVERSQDSRPDFAVTNENAPFVAEICCRLDGLPLAIELAAARSKLLSPQALLARLERRLPLLTHGARDLPLRHQTLRGTITWGYDLLAPAEQMLFRRLASFVGGCTVEAAEAVCRLDSNLALEVLEGLGSLVDNSLLQQEEAPAGEPRFWMLETIREYAVERLEAAWEAEAARRLHAGYFVALAEQASPEVRGPRQLQWMERLDREHGNVRAALAWALDQRDVETVARFVWALWYFWLLRGRLSEGRRWAVQGLAEATRPKDRAQLLFVAGTMAFAQFDYDSAQPMIEESLKLFRSLGDQHGIAYAVGGAGLLAVNQKTYPRGLALLEEAVERFSQIGDKWGSTVLLVTAAVAPRELGDYARAARMAEEGLTLARELGDRQSILVALYHLAVVALLTGDNARSTQRFTEALTLAVELGDASDTTYCLQGLGMVAAAEGHVRRGVQLWAAAEALLGDAEAVAYPHAADRSLYERHVAQAREHLDAGAWAVAWAEGQAMPLEQAVAYALVAPTIPG